MDVYDQNWFNDPSLDGTTSTANTKIPSPSPESIGLIAKPQKSISPKVKGSIKSMGTMVGRGKKSHSLLLTEVLNSSHFFAEDGCAWGSGTRCTSFVACPAGYLKSAPEQTSEQLHNDRTPPRITPTPIPRQLRCSLHSRSQEDHNREHSCAVSTAGARFL